MSDQPVPPTPPPARRGPPPLPPPALPGRSLGYAAPGAHAPPNPGLVIVPALWLAVAAIVFSVAVVWLVPYVKEVFADLKLELPGATKLLLTIHSGLAATYAWLLVGLLPALAPLLVLTAPPELARRRARQISRWTLLALLLFIALLVLALGIPMFTLIRGTSSNAHFHGATR